MAASWLKDLVGYSYNHDNAPKLPCENFTRKEMADFFFTFCKRVICIIEGARVLIFKL